MKKIMKAMALTVGVTSVLAGCQQIDEFLNGSQGSVQSVTVVDGIIKFDESTHLTDLAEADKKAAYESLDNIHKSTTDTTSPLSYSNVKEIETDKQYLDLILTTTKQPAVVYLGFDECPFCRVFLPKINQLAKEKGVTLNYYNVRKHANDHNFKDVMEVYNVKSVPQAFIVKAGKPIKNVNYDSTMEEIEAFITEAAK